jgi:ArsR family transcriptional regulator
MAAVRRREDRHMGDFVRAFRALGDPTRQRMLALLEERGELCVADLAGNFAMTQPSVSHHLRILKDAGLVVADKRGKEVFYAINPDELSRCCQLYFAKFSCCRPVLKPARRTAS